MTSLVYSLNQLAGETWEDTARRVARRAGFEAQVMEQYDLYISNGDKPEDAAFSACLDFYLLERGIVMKPPRFDGVPSRPVEKVGSATSHQPKRNMFGVRMFIATLLAIAGAGGAVWLSWPIIANAIQTY